MAKRFNMLLISALGCVFILAMMMYETEAFKGIEVNGFDSLIIALEFTTSEEQLNQILNIGKDTKYTRTAIANNTRFDFAFIFIYGLFLSSLIIFLFGERGLLTRFLITLVIIACTSDILENLAIMDLVLPATYLDLKEQAYLQFLSKATYMKWTLLFVVIGYSLWWKIRNSILSKEKWAWSFWLIFVMLFAISVVFVITSIQGVFDASDQAGIIQTIIQFNGILLICLLLWPVADLIRGIRALVK